MAYIIIIIIIGIIIDAKNICPYPMGIVPIVPVSYTL